MLTQGSLWARFAGRNSTIVRSTFIHSSPGETTLPLSRKLPRTPAVAPAAALREVARVLGTIRPVNRLGGEIAVWWSVFVLSGGFPHEDATWHRPPGAPGLHADRAAGGN